MRRRTGEERAGVLGPETGFRDASRRPECGEAKTRERDRMTRQMRNRTEHVVPQTLPRVHQRREQARVGLRIRSQARRGFFHGPSRQHGRAVVERMCEGRRRLDQLELEAD